MKPLAMEFGSARDSSDINIPFLERRKIKETESGRNDRFWASERKRSTDFDILEGTDVVYVDEAVDIVHRS